MTALARLFNPKTIAVFGGNWAANVIEQCRKMGFAGEVWPVHPSRDEIAGVKCFRSVADLPGAPDASFIGVNRELTIEVVRQLRERGAGGAVCFASGFSESESEGTGGTDLQARLVEAAGDMPVLGPNCYGFINYLDGALLWPDQHGGVPVERGVAILTQSSNIAINMTMQRRGLPLAFVVTAGNQAQTSQAEMAMALCRDPRITAIGLHIEGVGNVRELEALADLARRKGKPVVAIKVGKSLEAQSQTVSHTASLAGTDAGSRALFRRLGIPLVDTIPVFLEALKLLHVHGPLRGNGLASISCSGGEASLMADAAVGRDVRWPRLTEKQFTGLRAALGPMVALANPLDYHTYVWGKREAMTAAFTAMLDGPIDLAMLVLDWPRPDRCTAPGWDIAVEAIRDAARATGTKTAILASMPENMPEEMAADLVAQGIAPLFGMAEALAAAEAAYHAGRVAEAPSPVLLAGPQPAGTTTLNEAEAKAALAAYGLTVPAGKVVRDLADLQAPLAGLSFPVALKGLGIAHKSEAGAVALDLHASQAVLDAARAMPAPQGWLVEEMAGGAVCELIVGVTRDPAHGFVLTIAAGGVLAELLADSASLLVPASNAEIREALGSLKVSRLLSGYRGKPAGDIEAVVSAVRSVMRYVEAEAMHLVELDVNPLIVRPDGAVAVDALIVIAREEA
jgi:acyl-CoA synthetase (NDP forming)